MKYILPLLLILAFPAIAQDEAEDTRSTYSPDTCEFTITFPDEPYTSRRCDKEDKDKCYNLVSYTQVYGLDSTVNFRVICNPVDESVYEAYSPEVMEATLRAMTKQSVVETHNSSFREAKGYRYKQAGLVGEGHAGRTPMIYIAQLWIGEKSALSVEAELIGEELNEADRLFGDILKTIGHKGEMKKNAPKKEPKPEEKAESQEESAESE